MTRSALRIASIGILAIAGLPAVCSAQSFTGTLNDVISHGDFPLVEPPPGGPQWELLTIFVTDSVWTSPGEVDLFDAISPMSDRIIFINQPDDNGRLHARIYFGSDDEQGQLPPELPPFGSVPIIGQFPEGPPVTVSFTARRDDGTFQSIIAIIMSDVDQGGNASDSLKIIPSPGTAVLLAFGCLGTMRRRR